jgi:gliding motility-associated-like protein
LWQPSGATTSCITVTLAATTTYTINVTDNSNNNTTATWTVNVNPIPLVGFNASRYAGCTTLCTQFYNTTTLSRGSILSYTWTFGDGDTVKSKSPIYCYTKGGNYDVTLTVTSDSGCTSTLKRFNLIAAYPHPVAAFSVSPQFATIIDPTIQFTDKTQDQYNVSTWSWSFGDQADSTSQEQNPVHTYQDTGSFCATLAVMDIHGCRDTTTGCLVISPVFTLYIPSAFSPNGDRKNDIFQPKGQYLQSFEMYIFDRWGTEVYHTTDITQGWNGSINGGSTIVPEGTYIYKISVTDIQYNPHTYTGNIYVIK